MAVGDTTSARSTFFEQEKKETERKKPAAHLERAIETRTAERKRVSPRRRWLMDSRVDSGGWPPILVSSDSVASSHSWNPPSSNSRYFFW